MRQLWAALVAAGLAWGTNSSACAQEVPVDAVEIELVVVSAGGEQVHGGEVRVSPWTGPGNGVFGIGNGAAPLELWLDRDRDYTLEITAPAHATRRVQLSTGSTGRRLHVVLSIDPYVLPELRASTPTIGRAFRSGSISEARFDVEPLAYATVDEWLRDVPGTVVRGRGPGGRQLVTVRGSRAEDVLVLLDGVPLNSGLTGQADLSTIPTATLEGAMLLRGAVSHRYGSGAAAGVLLLSSRAPDVPEAGLAVTARSYGDLGLAAHAALGGGRRRLALSLSASSADNDFPYENRVLPGSPEEVRVNSDRSSMHAAATGAVGLADVSLRCDRVERGAPGRIGTTLFNAARATNRSCIAGLELSGNSGQLAAGFRHDRLGYRLNAEVPEEHQRVRELRLTGQVAAPWSLPLTVGGRFTREDVVGDGIEAHPSRVAGGAYVAGGVRAGRLRLDAAAAIDAAGGRSTLSPELSLTWLGSGRWHTWLRVGQGFRLPTFGDLYFASAYQVRPNVDLLAERVTLDAELGGSMHAGAGEIDIGGELVAWHRRTEAPIVWLASTTAVWSPRNLDALESVGAEAELEIAGSNGAGSGWRAQLAGTIQRSRVRFGTNRNPLPYQPGASGRMTLSTWRRGTGIRLDVRHTGGRTTSVAATRELPPFTTLDVSLTQFVSLRRLVLRVLGRVENLLDERYEMIELFPEPGRRLVIRLEASRKGTPEQRTGTR